MPEGEGAAALRRADHHDRQAGPGGRRDAANGGRCTRAGSCCATSRIATSSSKLFDTIAPRFEARPGGYTRILRLGYRRGDSAEVAQIELVGSEYNPNAAEKGEKPAAKKPKGVGGRLRAAAQRLRGKKADAGDGESAEPETKKAKPARAKSASAKSDTRGKAKTTAAPRKAGGS